MDEYVDVRGVWPIYVCKLAAVVLRGSPRDISVEEARIVVSKMQ